MGKQWRRSTPGTLSRNHSLIKSMNSAFPGLRNETIAIWAIVTNKLLLPDPQNRDKLILDSSAYMSRSSSYEHNLCIDFLLTLISWPTMEHPWPVDNGNRPCSTHYDWDFTVSLSNIIPPLENIYTKSTNALFQICSLSSVSLHCPFLAWTFLMSSLGAFLSLTSPEITKWATTKESTSSRDPTKLARRRRSSTAKSTHSAINFVLVIAIYWF